MRALQWFGRRDVRLCEVAEPAMPGTGEVLVDVEWCGICGTDVEEYLEGPIVIPTEPHPLTGYCAPITMGHEVVGRVAACGAGVSLAEGQLVALDGYLSCGTCRACRHHRPNRCERWAHIGMSYPGGLAERLVVPAQMAVPAPSQATADQLALAEPFAVAMHAVRRGRTAAGERIAVLGGGTVGLSVLQVALAIGCGSATLVEPEDARRALGRRFGAADVAADAGDLFDGGAAGSFDVVFDCTGSERTPASALRLARPGGRVVLVGLPVKPGAIDYQSVVLRELELIGTVGKVCDEDTVAVVALIASGRVDPLPLITHRISLEQTVSDGFEFLVSGGRTSALKILVSPNGDPVGSGREQEATHV